MDTEAESHMRLMKVPFCSSFGQIALRCGCIQAIPAIAAYDSWKPMLEMSAGFTVRCIMMEDASVVFRSGLRCSRMPVSRIIMKMRALIIDAPAPVAREDIVHTLMHSRERKVLAFWEFPAIPDSFDMSR